MQKVRLSAFKWVPPFAQGLVRDIRVRWALEEAGIQYEEKLISLEESAMPEYRSWQPFGQVPAYEEGDIVMFESGAIVLHIAEKSPVLMPEDPVARARTKTWVLAALNSIENRTVPLIDIDIFNKDAAWTKERRPAVYDALKLRLQDLAKYLEGKSYLENEFSAGDLMMVSVLRALRHTTIIAEMPILDDYVKRCEARPAFQKALTRQMEHFAKYAPQA
jgi:glutathione S-transferase